MNSESMKPQIRFKGFNDTWEQRKSKEVCQICTGGSNTQDQKDDGKYPFYIRSEIPVKSNRYLYDEEAVLTIGDGNIGKVFHYINGKFDLHQRVYKMSNFKGITAKYFYYYFSSNFYERAMQMTAKTSVDSVRLEMISEMDIKLPTKIVEQKKIATFLTDLDNLITLHQRKYDKLLNIKKSMLEKMFPKNDDDIPKIRFKGFDDAWEQRKLGDIFKYERPDNYIVSNEEYTDINRIPVLTANKGFILGYTNEKNTYNKPSIIFDDFTLDSKYVDFPYMVKSSAIKILIISDEKKDSLRFNFELLNNTKIEIMGHARHYISVVQSTEVFSTNITEQLKINKLFISLDNLITLHQRKQKKEYI